MPARSENFAIEQAIGVAARCQRLLAFLQNRVWPNLPADASQPWTKAEEERALGFGEHGELE